MQVINIAPTLDRLKDVQRRKLGWLNLGVIILHNSEHLFSGPDSGLSSMVGNSCNIYYTAHIWYLWNQFLGPIKKSLAAVMISWFEADYFTMGFDSPVLQWNKCLNKSSYCVEP